MNTEEKNLLDQIKSFHIKDDSYFYGKVPTEFKISEEEKTQILRDYPAPKFSSDSASENIRNYNANDRISNFVVLVNEVTIKKASNNNPYLDVTLSNNQGSFKGKVWADNDTIDSHNDFFTQNKVISISGKVDEYPRGSGNKSVVINSYIPANSNINPVSLLPITNKNFENMTIELVTYLNELKEPHKSIAFAGLNHMWESFSMNPAAKFHHHAYVGGLLKHTLGLIRLSKYIGKEPENPIKGMLNLLNIVQTQHKLEISNNVRSETPIPYTRLTWGSSIEHIYQLIHEFAKFSKEHPFDYDLLIASALYHDFGKYNELATFGLIENKYRSLFPFASDIEESNHLYNQGTSGIGMDELGCMVSHIPYGMIIFKDIIEKSSISVDLKTIHNYIHNILSHHGKLEWGSPVIPQTSTAVALHFVDYLDSRYETFEFKSENI